MTKKLLAEFIGTFWLVLGGCGSAVLAAGVADVGIGWLGVSLGFGLTVLTMAYTVGHISGGHFNPAVSLGLVIGGRFDAKGVAARLGGAGDRRRAGGDGSLCHRLGQEGFDLGGWLCVQWLWRGVAARLLDDVGTDHRGGDDGGVHFHHPWRDLVAGAGGPPPIAIGLGLTLIHLISIPVTKTSVNPARSRRGAVADGPALAAASPFWVAR